MKYLPAVLLLILMISLSVYPQSEKQMLVGERIVAFYPANFNPEQTLPSFALVQEPDSIGQVPADWEIFPVFNTGGSGNGAQIVYPGNVDLYGTGEVVGPLRRNGTEVTMWSTDSYGYGNSTHLYQSHPWIMGVRDDGSCFGILVDNTWKQTFYLDNPIQIVSEGPPFRILIIERDSPQEMMAALGELTGTISLPPLWALGYHQCRYSYYPDSRVIEIADTFRELDLPCDVIWMDIDYMDGFRVFTFDPTGFPDPAGLNDYLHQKHFKSIWMIDPGVKKEAGYFVYDSGNTDDIWVQNASGDPYVGEVWPGDCVFPDFTIPAAQNWWAGLYQNFMATGIDGVWNDMNEPAVFNTPDWTMPEDNIHRGGDGLPEDVHLRYHNVYGYLMVRSSREGIMTANPDKRPFVLTRANHLGGQRYAATWTGDNRSSFDHLKLSIPMSLSLGLSGQPFSGPDIGGFGGSYTGELLGQWMAVGAFYPFCRNHTSTGTADQEPWAFGKTIEDVSRTALNRRYRLMPYIYSLFHEASISGMPVMRPVFFADPANPQLREEEEAFMLGGDLLIVPRWADNPSLPGGLWRNLWLENETPDDYQADMLQRGGSIIPVTQIIESTADYQQDSITLLVSPDENRMASGSLYADAGDGWEYLNGQFLMSIFNASPVGSDSLLVTIENGGGEFSIPNRTYRVGVLTNYTIFYSDWTADTALIVYAPEDVFVDLIRPADGQTFNEGDDVFIQLDIQTGADIQQVNFYADDEQIAQFMEPPWEMNWTKVAAGTYDIYGEVVINDSLSVSSEVVKIFVGSFGSGQILYQVWDNLPGYLVSDLTTVPAFPAHPDENSYLNNFMTPIDVADEYGARIIGYVHPPTNGDYRFWIAGDDYCELWLSSDSTFAHRKLIAEVPGWSYPDEFEKYEEQNSGLIPLESGKKYCIVALQKEDSGGDFVEVAWEIPGDQRRVINGMFLSPYDIEAASVQEMSSVRLEVFPNPANNRVTIAIDETGGRIEIYDIRGRMITSHRFSDAKNHLSLDTGSWNPGIYLVKFTSDSRQTVKRLVIK